MKDECQGANGINRRQFLQTTALAGAAMLSPGAVPKALAGASAPVRTSADQVTLGKSGLKLSRLGFGLGTNNGKEQSGLGKEGFNKIIRYAYDHGITTFDTAETYTTLAMIGEAIKGLPREKLFIQSKIESNQTDALAAVDKHRKAIGTDYIDSVLMHAMNNGNWADNMKRMMDGLSAAQEKKWIRAKGISSHALPALRTCAASDWADVLLARVNPQGLYTDLERDVWNSTRRDVAPVMEQLKAVHAKGIGIIGMKVMGLGLLKEKAEREKSIRFVMACKDIDAIIIGFTSQAQMDEVIELTNAAVKEG